MPFGPSGLPSSSQWKNGRLVVDSLCFRASFTTNSPVAGTTPDRRQGSEEGMVISNIVFASEHGCLQNTDSISSLRDDAAPTRSRKCLLLISSYIVEVNEWMNSANPPIPPKNLSFHGKTKFPCPPPPQQHYQSGMTCFLYLGDIELMLILEWTELKVDESTRLKAKNGIFFARPMNATQRNVLLQD